MWVRGVVAFERMAWGWFRKSAVVNLGVRREVDLGTVVALRALVVNLVIVLVVRIAWIDLYEM